MTFDKRFSVGNIATIVVLIAGGSVQYGQFQKTILDIERRLEVHTAELSELRKDNRVGEALQRVAVMENNLNWIRADIGEIKTAIKKGAE